ncbi:MAG TPA: type II toxin-antitoxin system HicA family toxin [Bacteroidota bacterium]
MSTLEKTLDQILRGTSDANVSFNDICKLLIKLGFRERIKGSHHIYSKNGIEEIINLQPKGPKTKPYQVKQVRGLILKYKLTLESHE